MNVLDVKIYCDLYIVFDRVLLLGRVDIRLLNFNNDCEKLDKINMFKIK